MNLYEVKDMCRANFNEYLRKALSYIHQIENMTVLDIGCGTGVSILEIAKLTNATITAVDINKDNLNVLDKRVQELKYTERISIVHGSIETVELPERSFSIILAEGLFNIIGFKKGLLLTSRFLEENGFMIIHDELEDREMKLQIFQEHNFNVITSFVLDEKIWWEKYFHCIEKQIETLKGTNLKDFDLQKMFECEISEIEMYKKNPLKFRSMYYVIQKKQQSNILM